MENEIYIVHESGAVTIIDADCADTAIRQARSGGRKIHVFRDRESYLNYLNKLDEQLRLMQAELSN